MSEETRDPAGSGTADLLSMNAVVIQTGQRAYVTLPDASEARAVLIRDGGQVFARVPSLGDDYGLVRIDPAKTYVLDGGAR